MLLPWASTPGKFQHDPGRIQGGIGFTCFGLLIPLALSINIYIYAVIMSGY
jgi:hypothetical protein